MGQASLRTGGDEAIGHRHLKRDISLTVGVQDHILALFAYAEFVAEGVGPPDLGLGVGGKSLPLQVDNGAEYLLVLLVPRGKIAAGRVGQQIRLAGYLFRIGRWG